MVMRMEGEMTAGQALVVGYIVVAAVVFALSEVVVRFLARGQDSE